MGEALLHLGFLTRSTLDAAVTEQISNLQNALFRSNETLEGRVIERTAELQEALEKLTESNRVKANFIANMSHELRTPLAHMVGYVDLLDDRTLGELNDDQMNAIRVLKKSNARLGSLIDNLLFLSFDSNDSISLEKQSTPIASMINNIYKRFQDQATAANIEMSVAIEENLPLAYIDPEKIDLALSQIIDNAIKFNHNQGKVLIQAKAKKEGISLSVLDTGIGIPKDKIQYVQEPFVQLDSTSTRKYGGAGLGLNLAKRIIESHGSTLVIDSKSGQGSRISFMVPSEKGIS